MKLCFESASLANDTANSGFGKIEFLGNFGHRESLGRTVSVKDSSFFDKVRSYFSVLFPSSVNLPLLDITSWGYLLQVVRTIVKRISIAMIDMHTWKKETVVLSVNNPRDQEWGLPIAGMVVTNSMTSRTGNGDSNLSPAIDPNFLLFVRMSSSGRSCGPNGAVLSDVVSRVLQKEINKIVSARTIVDFFLHGNLLGDGGYPHSTLLNHSSQKGR